MPLPRKAPVRLRIAAAVLALALLLAGCGSSGSDNVKTVVIDNGSVSRAAVTDSSGDVSGSINGDISGDWYGWWRIYSTSGDWAQMSGCWWDCCAEIEDGSMLLWDEELPKDNYLAKAALNIDGSDIRCSSGSFLDRKLKSSSWDITLSADDSGTLMTVSGKYNAVGDGGFSYEIYLRPWGSKWPDGDGDKLPYYYKDWYLPLVEAGKVMPDVIGGKD